MNLPAWWESLSPRAKRMAVIGGVAASVAGVVIAFGTNERSSVRERRARDQITSILTTQDTRRVNVESLSAQLRDTRKDLETLKGQLGQLAARQDEAIEREIAERLAGLEGKVSPEELARLRAEMLRKSSETKGAPPAQATAPKPGPKSVKPQTAQPGTPPDEAKPGVTPGNAAPPTTQRRQIPVTIEDAFRQPVPAPTQGARASDPSRATLPNVGEIRFISVSPTKAPGTTQQPRRDEVAMIPAGSIMTGVLVTGLDAPTGQNARREPFPALLRIKHEAILPNRFTADIRECFVLLAAFGDLASERAMMRTEKMSCVLNDGRVVQEDAQGYAAGEDGKAGVRGRVVQKQGAYIARALLTGFIEGIGNALGRGGTQVLGLSPAGQVVARSEERGLGDYALQGAGHSLGRIAQWYLRQAEQLFPIIEVDAGRKLDVVLTGELKLALPN